MDFSFDLLPLDVVGLILSFLPHPTLNLAAQVCSTWFKTSLHDNYWTSRCYTNIPGSFVLSEVSRHASQLHSLCLADIPGLDLRGLLRHLESSQVEFMHLSNFCLVPETVFGGSGFVSFRSDEDTTNQINWPPLLKIISLKQCELPYQPFSNAPSLEKLVLDICSVKSFASSMKLVHPKLEYIYVRDCSISVTDQGGLPSLQLYLNDQTGGFGFGGGGGHIAAEQLDPDRGPVIILRKIENFLASIF